MMFECSYGDRFGRCIVPSLNLCFGSIIVIKESTHL